MTDLKALYEEDTSAWAENQAAALRAAAQGRSNLELDWENIAEEIEDLGKSIRRGIQSHVRNIIEHLVKLEHSPARQPREDWRDSIENARAAIDALLEESPSVKSQLGDIIFSEIPRGAKVAVAKLKARRELDEALVRELRSKSYLDLFSYTPEQILGDWFPAEPKG